MSHCVHIVQRTRLKLSPRVLMSVILSIPSTATRCRYHDEALTPKKSEISRRSPSRDFRLQTHDCRSRADPAAATEIKWIDRQNVPPSQQAHDACSRYVVHHGKRARSRGSSQICPLREFRDSQYWERRGPNSSVGNARRAQLAGNFDERMPRRHRRRRSRRGGSP